MTIGVLDEIVRVWSMPPEDRPSPDRQLPYYRDWRVDAPVVIAHLRQRFPGELIQEEQRQLLRSVIDRYCAGGIPDERQRFLVSCCLALAEVDDGVVDASLVQEMIGSLDSLYWHGALPFLIGKHLTESHVLAALRRGMKAPAPLPMRKSCLDGIRLYRGMAQKTETLAALLSSIEEVKVTLRELEQDPVPEIRAAASEAMIWLDRYGR